MILTCPACPARYEVADLALPAEGREIECLACGHVWQHLPEAEAAPDAPSAAPDPSVGVPPDVLAFLREEAARLKPEADSDQSPAPQEDATAAQAPDAQTTAVKSPEPASVASADAPAAAPLWRAAADGEQAGEAAGRGWLVLALILVLAGFLHLAAPTLARILPAAAPWLDAYTGLVEQGLARLTP